MSRELLDRRERKISDVMSHSEAFVVVVALLFYVHGKHLRSGRDGQLT